jgi:type II secretory pathway pseudopilin PulG
MGIAEVLIAAGLGTILLTALVLSMQKTSRFSKKMESSLDLSAIRARLSEQVDCSRTFSTAALPQGNPCPTGDYIELLASGGQVIVPRSGLVLGPWTLRAYCKTSDGSLDLRAAKLRPGAPSGADDWRSPGSTVNPANFLRDEMDSNFANASGSYSWNHPKSRLFEAGSAGLCANRFGGTANQVVPLVGNYTGPIVGVTAINSVLAAGIIAAWGSLSSSAGLSDWSTCRLSAPSGSDGEIANMASDIRCQARICNGFFRNRANPLNYSVTGVVPPSEGVATIAMGCLWTQDVFDANRIP